MILAALGAVLLLGATQAVREEVRLEKRTLYPYGNMAARSMAFDPSQERHFVVHGTSIAVLDTGAEAGDLSVLYSGLEESSHLPAERIRLDASVFDLELHESSRLPAAPQRLWIAGGTAGLLAMDVGPAEGRKANCACEDLGRKTGCYEVSVVDDREDVSEPPNNQRNNGSRWCMSVEVYAPPDGTKDHLLAVFSAAGPAAGVPYSQLRCYELPGAELSWVLDLEAPTVHQPGRIADYPVAYDLEVDTKEEAAYVAMGTAGICRVDLSALGPVESEAEADLATPSAVKWWHPEHDPDRLDALAPLPLATDCFPDRGCGRRDSCIHCYGSGARPALGFNRNSEQFEPARISSLSLLEEDGALYATADARGLLALDVSKWSVQEAPALRDAKLLVPTAGAPLPAGEDEACPEELYYAYASEVHAIRTLVDQGAEGMGVAHDVFVAGSQFPRKLIDRAAPWVSTGIWGHNLSVAKDSYASRVCPEVPLKPLPAGDLFLFRRVLGDEGDSSAGPLQFLRRYEEFRTSGGARQPFWYRDRALALVPHEIGDDGSATWTLYNQVAKQGVISFRYDPRQLDCDLERVRSYVPRLASFTPGDNRGIATPSIFGVKSSLTDPRRLFVSHEGARCGVLELAPGSAPRPIEGTAYSHQFGLLPIGAQWLSAAEDSDRGLEYFLRTQSFGDFRQQGWALTRIDSESQETLQRPSSYWLIPSPSVRDDFDGEIALSGATYFTSSPRARVTSEILLARAGVRYGALLTSRAELEESARGHECACVDTTKNLDFHCGENVERNSQAPRCILSLSMTPIDTHPEMADWRFEDLRRETVDPAVPDPRRILWHENASPGTLTAGKRRYYGTNLYTWEAELFAADLTGDGTPRSTAILAAGYHADDRSSTAEGKTQSRCTDLLGRDPSQTGGLTYADAADCHFSKAMIVLADLDYGLPESESGELDATDGEVVEISFGALERPRGWTPESPESQGLQRSEPVIRPFAAGFGRSVAGHALAIEVAEIHGRRYAFVADLAGRLLLFDVSDDVLQVAKLTFLERTGGATKVAYDGSKTARPVTLPLLQEVVLPPNYLDGDIDNVTDLLYSRETRAGEVRHVLYVTAGRLGLLRMRLDVWSGEEDELTLFEPEPDCGDAEALPYPPLPRFVELPPIPSTSVEIHDTAGLAQSIERVSLSGKEALVVGDQMSGLVIFGEY